MAYNPDETARPRSFSDKAATVSRYGLALPTAGAIAVGSIAGFLHGGTRMLVESGQKAIGLRPNESYEDLANKARQREAAPAEWVSEHMAFGEEASEMLNKTIGGIFEYVNKTGERKGQEVLEATGSPLAATIAESSFKILPYLGAEVLGFRGARAAKQAATIKGTDFVPTPKEWKASFATPKNRSRYQHIEWADLEHPEPTSKFDISPNEPVKEVKPPIDAVALEEKYLSEGQGMALDLESRGFPVMYNGPQMNARGELAYHTFTITEKGMETTFGGKTLDDVVAKYNTKVREFGREDLVKEVKTGDQLFDELRSHPLYQKREALYADNMEISIERGKDITKEHPDLDKREAENRKEIDALSKQIHELPENKAWMKQRDADNLVLQKQELEGQRDYDLANRDKWDKAPRHGTDIDALPGILEEGLRYGSAIDVSKGFDWAGESPIQIILPSVRKGARIEHNNYYKSGNVARAAKVIVDLDHYTKSASASVKEQILALAEKHKDVEFVIKDGRSKTVLNDKNKLSPKKVDVLPDDSVVLTEVSNWLLGKGNPPKAPTKLYRGQLEQFEAMREGEYIHTSPWPSVAQVMGKGPFGFSEGVSVFEYPVAPNQKYYRGGSLAGDPLEATSIYSHKGMTWEELIKETERVYKEKVAEQTKIAEQAVDEMGYDKNWLAEEKQHIRKDAAKETARELYNASLETDALNRPGKWSSREAPEGFNRRQPELRTENEVIAFDQKKTINEVLDNYTPDNITDAAFITTEGKPVGSLKDGGHGATIENITAELGWDDLFTHEDMGRAATTERTGLINRVALEGENIFATSDKTMTHEAAQKAVARYLRDAGIEEGSLEFNGELEVVKAAPGKKNIVPPEPKGKTVKSPVRKVRKPRVKPDPLEGLDQDMTIGEISKTGRDYMSSDQLAAQIEKTVEKGDTNAFLRAAVKFTAQAKKRKSILLAKQYARAICADLPDNIHHTYRAIIEDLRSGIDPTFRSEKRMADLNSTMEYLKSQPKEMDAMPSRILKLLAKKHLNDFTLRDLHEIHDRIYNPQNGLIKLGQLRRSLEVAKEQRAANAVVEGMLESLSQQKTSLGYVPRDVLSPEPRALKKRSIIDKITHGKLMTLIPQHVFDIFDNNANFGGVFHEFLYKQADRTVTQEKRMTRVIADRADARMEQLGIKLKDWNKRTQVAGTTMSRQQMLGVYLAQKNPYNYHLMQELHPELTDTRIQAIIAELTPQEKAFGKHILEDHAKSFNRIAEVRGKVSNQTLGKEPNYTNIVFDRPEFERLSFEEKVNVTLSMRESIKRAVPFDKFTLERLGLPANAKPRLNLNAIDNWYNHVANREHYIAAAEWTKQANRIISDKRLLGELERTHGEPAVEYIRSYIQEIANPRSIRDMSRWAQVSRLLRRNTAVAYIGLNPNSVLIQTASIPKFLRDAGAFNLAGSLVRFCRNPVEMYKRVCEWEPQIKDRYFERELQELGEIHKTVVGGAIEKGQKAVLTPTTLMDRIAIVVGYDAVYKRYVKDLGHEGAKQKALDAVNRTQSGTHPKDLAPLYKQKNEALNWVTIFTNDLSKSWGEAFHTLPADIKAGRIMEAMYTTAGFGLMATIAYTILHKTFPDSPEKVADAFTEQSLAMLPLVGSVTMARKQGYADAGSPVMNTLSLPGYLLSDNSASSKRRKALEAAAILTGVPFSAPKKVAMSIKEDDPLLLLGRGDDWKHKSGGSNRRLGISRYRSRRSRSGRKYLR